MTPIQLCCVSDLVVEASLGLDMLIHTRVIVIIQYASTVSNDSVERLIKINASSFQLSSIV